MNWFKSQLREIQDKSRFQEVKGYFGPIAISCGVIAIANCISVPKIELINLVLGLVLFVCGFVILFCLKNPTLFRRTGIPVGFTIFSAGVRISRGGTALNWVIHFRWSLYLLGLLLMMLGIIFGFSLFRKTAH